jgi:hypothetical protein
MTDKHWVEVARASRDEDAELLAGFLRSEEIETIVENRRFHMEPVTFGDLAVIRILVVKADAARALGLIEKRGREFEKMIRSGDRDSILTDNGPADAPGKE